MDYVRNKAPLRDFTNVERVAYELHLRLLKATGENWGTFDNYMNDVIHREKMKRQNVLRNKYQALKEKQNVIVREKEPKPTPIWKDSCKISRQYSWQKKKISCWIRDFKYCLPCTEPPIEDFIVDIMASINDLPEEAQHEVNEAKLRTIGNIKKSQSNRGTDGWASRRSRVQKNWKKPPK